MLTVSCSRACHSSIMGYPSAMSILRILILFLSVIIGNIAYSYNVYINGIGINIENAVPDHYEADKYLLSQYLVTNLHLSKIEGKRPLILMLGGSNEWFTHAPDDWKIADFLARGYHVLEAEYFLKPKISEIPDKLSHIRLESFWEEIGQYLKSDRIPEVIDENLIGVMGTSKGGELALVLSSLYPQFKFVIGLVPSHVVFQASNKTLYRYSSWVYVNKPLDFVPYPIFSFATIYGVLTSIFSKKPENVNFTWMHNQALTNLEAVEKATIKVENINGPILLVSGEKDQWWPSADMSRAIMKRLADNKFSHSYVHFQCDADHFPYARKPKVWKGILDRADEMVEEIRNW